MTTSVQTESRLYRECKVKCLAWDVTMPDNYAQSHLPTSATNVGHAADKSAISKTQKYQSIWQTHLFTSIFNRNSWRIEQPSKRIHQRTSENVSPLSPRSKRGKLYLSVNLSGNSERQHAVFHWVFHHRHGLNTNNNSSNNSDDNNKINH